MEIRFNITDSREDIHGACTRVIDMGSIPKVGDGIRTVYRGQSLFATVVEVRTNPKDSKYAVEAECNWWEDTP